MDDYSWQDFTERKSASVVKMKKHGLMLKKEKMTFKEEIHIPRGE